RTVPTGPADPRMLTAVLVVAAGASAVVAVGTFGGVTRILQAAWARPTVSPAPSPAAPGHQAPGGHQQAGPPAGPAVADHPPTVAIDLSGGALGAGLPFHGGSPAAGSPAPGGAVRSPAPPGAARGGAQAAQVRSAFEVVLGTGRTLRPG